MTRFLIFDLDGTISNPFAGIHNSVNYALSAFGHPQVPTEAFHDIGISKQQQLARLVTTNSVSTDALMIGDHDIDIVSARANGLEAIGVLWGFGSHAELAACAALHIATRPCELLELLP